MRNADLMSSPFCALTRLTLTDFRNHSASQMDRLARMNVLTGKNGAGKTNILEALSLLSAGRGMRGAPNNDMARRDGTGGFFISCRLDTLGGEVRIGTGLQQDQPGRRLVRVNGEKASQSLLSEYLTVNWLTPAHDRLFVDGAGARRRYLDRLSAAVRPGHLSYVQQYESAMRERNRLLIEARTQRADIDPLWLDALEDRMGRYATVINAGRLELVDQMETMLDSTETGIFAKPGIALLANGHDGRDGTDDKDSIAGDVSWPEIWKQSRNRDMAAGRTLSGPHRDDLKVWMRQSGEAAALTSTGQQKAMLIALTLTHCELVIERHPRLPALLLLDEVAAHLDVSRRAALFEQLAMRPMQVWMTGTETSLFEGLSGDHHFINVEDGGVADCG